MRVRVLKVDWPAGDQAGLATTRLAATASPAGELQRRYGLRGGVETDYDRGKNSFASERGRGPSVLSIEQACYGGTFLAPCEGVLSKGAEADLAPRSPTPQWHSEARVTRPLSSRALVEHTVALLLDPHVTVDETIATLHPLFNTNPARSRPGRHVPRKVRSRARQVWFLRYAKRLIA